ncbi:hypothetical protein N799_11585 [Lysobacter arseniciresistens ZS79]|uniref:Uncharacterized protein n=1 Tax=Lysobacter arseniciresistens ZS79 TaxID=913325 RepID=A0A0A0EVF2_9GAMM|nr:hypothetical protein N799_11585 [Lysobacter arseniciresistens ZS79]
MSPQAQAQDSLTRVLVNVADVVMRGSTPYYRYGNNGYGDPLAVQHDRYGRPLYYRTVNGNGGHHDVDHRADSNGGYYSNTGSYGSNGYYGNNGYYDNTPYANSNGYYRNGPGRYDRSASSRRHRQHDRHDRHDCQDHGQCGH